MSKSSFIIAAGCLLCAAEPALAGPKKDQVVGLLLSMTLLPLALYPIGLACHLILASLAPYRSEGLSLDLQDHYWKTLLLGLCNAVALIILAGVFQKRAPGLASLCSLALLSFMILGLHGIVRSTGDWILENCARLGPTTHALKSIAVGWFVILYVSCIPLIGWFLGCYWIVRGIGGVVLQIAGRRKDESPIIKIKL
jgi:hypothetical protein